MTEFRIWPEIRGLCHNQQRPRLLNFTIKRHKASKCLNKFPNNHLRSWTFHKIFLLIFINSLQSALIQWPFAQFARRITLIRERKIQYNWKIYVWKTTKRPKKTFLIKRRDFLKKSTEWVMGINFIEDHLRIGVTFFFCAILNRKFYPLKLNL